MEENIEGQKATEQKVNEILDVIGGFPKPSSKPVEPTEESKVIDDICRNLGI
jgi:hypothetical protein